MIGMIRVRVSSSAAFKDTARLGRRGSRANSSNAGVIPEVETVTRRFRPRAVLAWGEHYDSPLFAGRDDGVAYVCERYACRQPTADAGELAALLS